MITIRTLQHIGLVGLALVVATPVAHAQIPNYAFRGVDGLGSLADNLDDRLGHQSADTEHYINSDDCLAYTDGSGRWKLTVPEPTGSWTYGNAHSAPGQTCPTTSSNITPSNPDLCFVINAQKELTTDDSIDVDIPFNELMGLTDGGSCSDGTEALARIYVVIEEPSLVSVYSETIEIIVDLKAPVAVESVTAEPGNQRFVVSWTDDNNDADDTEYILYWDDVDFSEGALSTVRSVKGITATTVEVESSSLENGVQYYVRVVAVDKADNPSTLSPTVTVIPELTRDFWTQYQDGGGGEIGDFCFIATASYGAGMGGELTTLRSFRDQVLMQSTAGRAFVSSYYRYGRFAAAWIADKPALKAVVRVALIPLIWLAQLMLWFGPIGGLAALGAMWVLATKAKRSWQAHILRAMPLEVRR